MPDSHGLKPKPHQLVTFGYLSTTKHNRKEGGKKKEGDRSGNPHEGREKERLRRELEEQKRGRERREARFKVRHAEFVVLACMLKGYGRAEHFDAVCTGNSSGERTVWRSAFYKFVSGTSCSDCRVSARRRVSSIMIGLHCKR